MKPVRSFLFLFLLLVLLAGADRLSSYFRNRQDFSFKTLGVTLQKEWSRGEDAEISAKTPTLQSIWEQDTLMNLYREIYRLDADIFLDESIRDIPLSPFAFDSSLSMRKLLDDFFVKLLILRNPDYEKTLRMWYAKPDFWTEELADNRAFFTRILHFGDRRIEDGRMTETVRGLFQKHFGGAGVGLLPLFQPHSPLQPKISGPWYIVKPDKSSAKGNYGVYNAHLTSPPLNTLLRQKKREKGTITYKLPASALPAKAFLDMVVHADCTPASIKVSVDGKPLAAPAVLRSFIQQRFTYTLPENAREITIEADLSRKNNSLYAVAVNDTAGVSVDNLPLRAGEAAVFTPNNRRFLTDQFNLLNTGLVIYQFGAGALKTAAGQETDYGYFRMTLLRELGYIRAQMPDIPVIVVGGRGDTPAADPAKILNIQREAAAQTGCIFWDASVLKGDGNPETEGKMFYKALLDAYRDFLLRERKESMLRRAKQLQSL